MWSAGPSGDPRLAGGIASAVEEQSAATQEIVADVASAAAGAQGVSDNVVDLRHGADETGAASAQVLAAARGLARGSQELDQAVTAFLAEVKAA